MLDEQGRLDFENDNQWFDAIENGTFEGFKDLTDITIPGTVRTLGDFCFCFCTNLRSIKIPSSVKTIDKYCFAECSNLHIVTILANKDKDNTIDISGNAFEGCPLTRENICTLNNVVYCVPDSLPSLG
jgi:hypothetical protein